MNVSKIEMNISKIEPPWSQELNDYMEERYGIDLDELMCEAILECEYEELRQECKDETAMEKRSIKE